MSHAYFVPTCPKNTPTEISLPDGEAAVVAAGGNGDDDSYNRKGDPVKL